MAKASRYELRADTKMESALELNSPLGHDVRRVSISNEQAENESAIFKRLFQRLRDDIPDYEFFDNFTPFHSSYDNWHYFGKRRRKETRDARRRRSMSSSRPANSQARSEADSSVDEETEKEKDYYVVARVSKHTLRLEREFKLAQRLCKESDPEFKYFVKPLQFGRLHARKTGELTLSYSIVEAPGKNYLKEIVEFGPNFYQGCPSWPQNMSRSQVSLLTFLDFAIGATQCCELLHHGNEMVHGEVRGDAFHYNT